MAPEFMLAIIGMGAALAAGGGTPAMFPPTLPSGVLAYWDSSSAASSSGRSTVWRGTYLGSYNLLMNETGRPDTTDAEYAGPVFAVCAVDDAPARASARLVLNNAR